MPRPAGDIPVRKLRRAYRDNSGTAASEATEPETVAAPNLDAYSAALAWLLIGWLVPSLVWYWLPITGVVVLCTKIKYWIPGAILFLTLYFF